MGKFQKGQPRPKGAGRKPGSKNKITKTVKTAFEQAFAQLQENPKTELTAWAMKNATNLRQFYAIAARFIQSDTPPPPVPLLSQADMLETARRIAVLFRRVRLEREAEEPRSRLLPERVVNPAEEGGEK